MLKAAKIGSSYLLNYLNEMFRGNQKDDVKSKSDKLRLLKKTLEKYGGMLAKIAQMLSYGTNDSSIFSDLEAFSRDDTDKYVKEYFKKNILPYEIEDEIFKSGSIGQIYKGSYNRKKIILKVKYVGLDKQTDEDLKAVRLISKFLYNVDKTMIAEALEKIKNTIMMELNFFKETEQHKIMYEIWEGINYVKIPKIYENESKENMIIMEYIDGESVIEFSQKATQEERNQIAYDLVRFVFTNIYQHKILYSDLHVGNLIISYENNKPTLNVVDYGCLHRLDKSTYKYLKKLHRVLKQKDINKFFKYITKLKIINDVEELNENEKLKIFNVFYENNVPWGVEKKFKFTSEWVSKRMQENVEIVKIKKLKLPKELLYFNKIPFGLFHILAILNAECSFYEILNNLI